MIIGTLPVVIPVFANLLYSQRDGKLSWRRLAPALALIGVGLLCVNIAELNQGCRSLAAGATVQVSRWRWFPLCAGHGTRCVMPAGCGKTRINIR
ncbi:Inner membrane protein ytfF [Citrobacter koseri]|nr:Inner membrane protein ytfF [Citrobacter koseri]